MKPLKLDYIIIYQKSGLPIYSNCFSGFCANLKIDETLLSGFLSAISTMPEILGTSSEAIKSVDLENVKLCFNHTTPSGHIMCLGIEKKFYNSTKNEKQINDLFRKIDNFIETEYGNFDFSISTSEERALFGEKVVHDIILPSLGYVRQRCACGKTCEAFSSDVLFSLKDEYDKDTLHNISKTPIWKKFNTIYSKKPNKFSKFVLRILIKLYIWRDNKIYEKKMKLIRNIP